MRPTGMWEVTITRMESVRLYDIGGRAMQELLPRVESGTETESNAGRLHLRSNYRERLIINTQNLTALALPAPTVLVHTPQGGT